MRSSFNAFGQSKKLYDAGSVPVWLGTVTAVPVGGTLPSAFVKKDALFPAGTPICLDGKTITPLVAFVVVSYTAATTGDYDTIVIKPCTYGGVDFIPAANDMLQKLGANFAATGKAAKVVAVTALTGDDAGKYEFTVDKTANLGSLSANDILVYSASATAGTGKAMANQPNAYLYNDIFIGDIDPSLEGAGASGAAVKMHAEGILINRTPAADFKAAMAAAVPGVVQVNY